jgi:hypothetical protein
MFTVSSVPADTENAIVCAAKRADNANTHWCYACIMQFEEYAYALYTGYRSLHAGD